MFFLRFSAEDVALLRPLASNGEPLLVTWTTGGKKYTTLALNLAQSVRANVGPELEQRFVCIALDQEAQELMQRHNFHSVLHEVSRSNNLDDAIWKLRWMALYTFAHLGINSLVLDSDRVALSSPFAKRMRHEDHCNTGCIYVKASKHVEQFLLNYLQENNESMIAGIQRDWFDQKVFGRFVERHVFRMEGDQVHVVYGTGDQEQVHRNLEAKAGDRVQRPLRIRVLDPVVFAHGMNYFYMRAHLAPGRETQVATAHANGVNDKNYFLRDRGLWYIDDFD
ncbi:unnamed protein product [Polarella glacialis]|uniref:Nucleotide-diphospho-sugar transferase domain-containing protein n=1 Tax=Polarella glacialis TaxID=89957 RepID=A0A813FN94_POLGL|nr:unnamed protein product [Polarella glacialis]CAE8722976.1 unnamed protein product [Polarella glacialis]